MKAWRPFAIVWILVLWAAPAWAIIINNYSAARNNRFNSGYPNGPLVQNTNSNFIGLGYDWSGVGWVQGSPNTSLALLTPRQVLMANHYKQSGNIQFVSASGQVTTALLQSGNWQNASAPTDLATGTFTAPLPQTASIQPYSILFLGYDPSQYLGYNVLNYGWTSRIGSNTINHVYNGDSFNFSVNTRYFDYMHDTTTPDRTFLQGGDSGSPSFIVTGSPGAMFLVGGHYAIYTDNSGSVDTFLPMSLPSLNSDTVPAGYLPSVVTPTTAHWTSTVSSTWGTSSNWSSGTVPNDVLNGSSQVTTCASVLFDGVATLQHSITLSSTNAVTSLAFNLASSTTSGFTFSGSALTLGEAGLTNNDIHTQTFNNAIVLRTSQQWHVGTGGLAISATGSLNLGTNQLLYLDGSGTSDFKGVISGGSSGIAKDGSGTLILGNANNSFSGQIFVHNGTLQFASIQNVGVNSALGSPANATLGTIYLAGTLTYVGSGHSSNRLINVADGPGAIGTTTGIIDASGTGTLVLTGGATCENNYYTNTPITGTSTLVFQGSGNGSESGLISNGGTVNVMSLVKAGIGTWTLSGSNTYSGTTTVIAGILQLSSSSAPAISGNLTVSGGTAQLLQSNQIAAAKSVNISAGLLDIAAFNNTVGGVQLTGGAITGTTGLLTSTTAFDVQSGIISANLGGNVGLNKTTVNTVVLSGSNTYTGNTTISAGAISLNNANAVANSTVTVSTNNGLLFNTSSGTISAFNVGALSGSGNTSLADGIYAITLSTGGNGASTTYSGALSGSGALTKAGTGILAFTGNNSYSGGTTISAGTLQIGNGGTSGSLVGNITDNSVLLFNRSDNSTFSGVISGVGSLVKLGVGTLLLTASNTYTGTTTISAGAISLNNANAVANSTVTVSTNNGLLFNTSSGTISAFNVGALSGSGNISLADGIYAITLSTGGNGASTTYSGALSGSGALTKAGTGILALTGNNSYSGGTSINGGMLSLGSMGALGTNGTISFGGGTLQFTSSNSTDYTNYLGINRFSNAPNQAYNLDTNAQSVTLAGNLTSSGGSFNKLGTGTLVLSGSNTYTGTTTISAGTLQIGSGGTSGSLVGNITDNSALVFNRSDNLTFGGVISGIGSLTKAGSGTLILTGSNSYSGGTTVSAGILQIGNGGTSDSLAGNITNNSALVFNLSDNPTFGGVISGAGGLAKLGVGTILLTASNTYTGNTTISAGAITLNNANALASSTVTVNTNNGLLFNTSNGTISAFDVGGLSGSGNISLTDGIYPLTLSAGGNGASTTYGGALSGSGALTKTGTGTLTLTGNNTYSGVTTVSTGILQIGSGGTSGSLAGNITDNTVVMLYRSDNVTFGGVISGVGGLAKLGVGTLLLTASNTYTGDTTIVGGAISLNNANAVANSTVTVNTNNGLRFNTSNGTISAFNVGGLSGSGNISLTDGIYPLTLSAGSNGASTTYSGALSGSGALTKTGAGILTLSGTNTYTGGTRVDAGTLIATNSQSLPDGYSLTVGAGGTLIFDSSFHASTPQSLSYAVSPMIQVVPEPSTFALLGTAALGLLGYALRRRKPA